MWWTSARTRADPSASPGRGAIGVLWDESIAATLFDAAQSTARTAGLPLISLPIKRQEEFGAAIQRAARERARGLLVLTSPLVVSSREPIARTAREHRLPSICAFLVYADAGGLLAYGPDLGDMWRRKAFFVDQIGDPAAEPHALPLRIER